MIPTTRLILSRFTLHRVHFLSLESSGIFLRYVSPIAHPSCIELIEKEKRKNHDKESTVSKWYFNERIYLYTKIIVEYETVSNN